ncbi:hypothetical protein [Rubrivivax albus]|uniref:DUF222 domain-containing protein n=1 Tax=Rubrivivax albus TaxID=2499835 RepID=A0A3S2ULT6_9BURK|nr:hypothetical protein [Rubrivivax albus]RVT48553.1 hypothetical protein ENE75_23025 [Rubrivivax albus]
MSGALTNSASVRTDIERLEAAFVGAAEAGHGSAELALLSGLPEDRVQILLADADVQRRLARVHREAELDGRAGAALARYTTLRMLRGINDGIEAGELDAGDYIEALPKIHRIVEHADRMQLEMRGGSSLPVFNIIIGAGGQITAERVETVDAVVAQQADTTRQAASDADRRRISETPPTTALEFLDDVRAGRAGGSGAQ